MSTNMSASWHKASFERFLNERLPQLLAERLPLAGYQFEPNGAYNFRVVIALTSNSSDIEIEYAELPQPDKSGVFKIQGQHYVVVPTASQEELDVAEIRCVGEQLYDFVEGRMGLAPPDLVWDEALARAWLPINTWIDEFLRETAQRLDTRNWLSRQTHVRRVIVPNRKKVIAPGQMGRVCPFETPEGPNTGRVFTVAVGAEIRKGKLVIVDERPEAGLSPSASMIPFLEHNDPNRLLMGANMMRQWFAPPEPEPALVQTGHEPDAPDFWCGRNLLTAFVSWGPDTVADGIVISESCAQRLNTPYPAEAGDKLSNRHGTKGVVSRVLPDAQMPHLPDGTPVELVFNFSGMHVRMNFGQVLEAAMGRVAQREGSPAIVPAFHSPGQEGLRQRLADAGLPESGMETLTLGRDGPRLQRPSIVGPVYWGRTFHVSRSKVRRAVRGQEGQMQGELEHYALRDLGAYENLAEYNNTCVLRHRDAATLADRVARGAIEQAEAPTPKFLDLADRLRAAGIEAKLEMEGGDGTGRLSFRYQPPAGDVLKLAQPVPHPWLPERQVTQIGKHPTLDAHVALIETNARLERMIATQTPDRLIKDALAQLESHVKTVFDELLTPRHLCFGERLLFSGRAIITPSSDLHLNQVGLTDDIAWTLFGPLVKRELQAAGEEKSEEAMEARTAHARRVLDEVMARSWIIVNRAPSLTPTALLAFRPLREPGHVIRIHPLACEMLDADFDGDQVAVFLPVTQGAQHEAGERLTVAAHLKRDPGLITALLPPPDALWGLANLSLTPDGRREIGQLAGIKVAAPTGFVTRASLAEAMGEVLERDGVDETLSTLERLMQRGLEVAKASGASLSPFIGTRLNRPPHPQGDDPEDWDAYADATVEQIISGTDFDSIDLGPQLLAVKIRQRGLSHLAWLIGPRGQIADASGKPVVVRHSYAEGLTADEMYACIAGARKGLADFVARWEQLGDDVRSHHKPEGFNVLARARRAKRPGIVFARAAASGEADPLADIDSRLFVGLPVRPGQ